VTTPPNRPERLAHTLARLLAGLLPVTPGHEQDDENKRDDSGVERGQDQGPTQERGEEGDGEHLQPRPSLGATHRLALAVDDPDVARRRHEARGAVGGRELGADLGEREQLLRGGAGDDGAELGAHGLLRRRGRAALAWLIVGESYRRLLGPIRLGVSSKGKPTNWDGKNIGQALEDLEARLLDRSSGARVFELGQVAAGEPSSLGQLGLFHRPLGSGQRHSFGNGVHA